MTTLNCGRVVRAVTAHLQVCQEATAMDIAQQHGIDRYVVLEALRRMARPTKDGQKRAHVVRYVYDQEGARPYPRAVYALGDGIDAPRPKPDKKAIKSAYYRRCEAKAKCNSVFNLAKEWRAR